MRPNRRPDDLDASWRLIQLLMFVCLLLLMVLVVSRTASAADFDGDTVDDSVDNCPCIFNSLQINWEWVGGIGLREDYDIYGNACDGDWSSTTLESHQDGIVGMPDFNNFVYCLHNGNTGEQAFPIIPQCWGANMLWDGVIDANDYVMFQAQLARGTPGPGLGEAAECAP